MARWLTGGERDLEESRRGGEKGLGERKRARNERLEEGGGGDTLVMWDLRWMGRGYENLGMGVVTASISKWDM